MAEDGDHKGFFDNVSHMEMVMVIDRMKKGDGGGLRFWGKREHWIEKG